jgi:hypothetical protein
MKLNCWETKKCGREPSGKNVNELGVCPAAIEENANGINFGKNGGRACWALAGTFCDGTIQATFAKKIVNCILCSFYKQVLEEEGKDFVPSLEIHERIEDKQHQQISISSFVELSEL